MHHKARQWTSQMGMGLEREGLWTESLRVCSPASGGSLGAHTPPPKVARETCPALDTFIPPFRVHEGSPSVTMGCPGMVSVTCVVVFRFSEVEVMSDKGRRRSGPAE